MWLRRKNMWTRQHRRSRAGVLIVPAITAAFLAYFGFHAYHGEFGIYSKYRLESRAAELRLELAAAEATRYDLERRVRTLQDGTIARDMLDEQARRALNLSHPDELTIFRRRPAAVN